MKYFPIVSSQVVDSKEFFIPYVPPLSLYIHYPWCSKKCPYCDFNSHAITNHDKQHEKIYLTALILDLQQQLPLIWNRTINTIFIGGGTPNLISPYGIDYLLTQLRALLPLQPDAEITMEANPGIVSQDSLKAYYDSGVNRLSIGIQSLHKQHLQALGRCHTADEALHTLEMAQAIFPRVNADLMYGLPSQNVDDAQSDIQQIIKTGVTHISAYQLSIEPNTWFYHHPPNLPKESQLLEIEQIIHTTLQENAYDRYEIAAFAKDKQRCQHNLNYWQFGDYIGIGAGSHGKLTLHNKIIRTQHKKNPKEYIQSIHAGKLIPFDPRHIKTGDITIEFMLNALRLIHGFPLQLYETRTGLSVANIRHLLILAQSKGFIELQPNYLRPTTQGINYLNHLLEIFL